MYDFEAQRQKHDRKGVCCGSNTLPYGRASASVLKAKCS